MNVDIKKRAVLFVNIGSPDKPEPPEVKTYLDEFLMDPQVIGAPYFIRYLLIKKLITPKRSFRSAEAYQKIWLKEGSPLIVYTKELMDNLNLLDKKNEWFMAMRYSQPRVIDQLRKIKDQGFEEIVLLPAYPQYAASSTQSTIDYVKQCLKTMGWSPELKIINDFYDSEEFIDNIISEIPKSLDIKSQDHFLFSFHGLPQSHIKKISKSCEFGACCETITEKNKNCYRAQCYQTAFAVSKKLNLKKDQWSISFQSRLGPLKWIPPYTDVVAPELVTQKAVKNLTVFSLAFVTDCLETLEELDMELKKDFLEAGGESFIRIPCLNGNFISAIDIVNKI